MKQELLIGITESGVMHTDADPLISLDTKFQMVKESCLLYTSDAADDA